MKFLTTLTAAFFAVSLYGCGSNPTKPANYNDKNSFALNVTTASGGLKSLKDTEVPEEQKGKFINSGVADIAWLSASYTNPLGGLSGGASLGLNAAAWLFAPEDPAKESRVLAWLPKNIVGSTNSTQAFSDSLSNAYAITAKEFNFISVVAGSAAEKFVGMGSKDGTNMVIVGLREPKEMVTPAFIGEGESYLFTTDSYDEKQSVLKLKKFEGISELKFLMAYSKNLPAWIFLYIAPGKLKDDAGNEIKIPFVLNQGKTHFFVK